MKTEPIAVGDSVTLALRAVAREAAISAGIDPVIFDRQIMVESRFDPSATSPAGARGIAQLTPGTARAWGVDPSDPVASLQAAAQHMAGYVERYGNYPMALAAYNAGPGSVERYGGVPPFAETRNYVSKILGSGPNPPGRVPAVPSSSREPSAQAEPRHEVVPGARRKNTGLASHPDSDGE
jgi:hypothetical protein